MTYQEIEKKITHWYTQNKRDLPWRNTNNPYFIWIAEVMLQQTTVNAVIPYYNRFISSFPSIKALANSPLEEVYQHWAGLGYYSRARNIHLAAQTLLQNKQHLSKFPKSYKDLLTLPGFGPYTARSVASFAFDEAVGVLDGNVIRFLSRYFLFETPWWNAAGRKHLQSLADKLAQAAPSSSNLNQALIEIGACICTPTSPACLLCPVKKSCQGLQNNKILSLPIKKPKREKEIWIWRPQIIEKKNKVLLIRNNYAPFLKGAFIYPGTVTKESLPPKKFAFKHNITHHEIYVIKSKSSSKKLKKTSSDQLQWVAPDKISAQNPSSLLKKAEQFLTIS